jgi:hypothetical protein
VSLSMLASLPLVLLLYAPPATAHPLDACEAERGSVPYNTAVTLRCPEGQVSVRRYLEDATPTARLEEFRAELGLVAEALETTLTWNAARIELGGASRDVAQYTLKKEGVVVRVGLVTTQRGAESREVVECATDNPLAPTTCADLVGTVLTQGLPGGAQHLPFPRNLRKARVLGVESKVALGCRAQWVFDDAMHVACPDAELIFGAAEAMGKGLAADPVQVLQEQIRAAPQVTEAEVGCVVAGVRTTCWKGTGRAEGGFAQTAYTARFRLAGRDAEIACLQTALGAEVHVQCAELLVVP